MFNTTGMNRESPGRTSNNRRGTGNNRDGTGTAPPRQSYGKAPVNVVRVPKTGALPERHRHSMGLRRGITSDDRALPGSDAGIDTVSAGAFTGAQPGHYRQQLGLCRDAVGFHRGTTGDNRDKP
ncbi:hypothetical protein DPMN_062356 [Dreissena polymorpha]|uniref:Uncharacterized protein n=1 Tax=Dreissena polymorpha TaxID=45954 RepID=A0A9D4C9R2_DREPO|nr:hypothetical protein DPMN_062356 [Dreissena polymorpha]